MNKTILGLAAVAVSTFAATAAMADGAPRGGSMKDAPVAPACGTSAYNWNGAFAGVQIGTANFRSTTAISDVLDLSGTREEAGFSVGGVIGYNWQKCNTVFGIEAELNWNDIDRNWGINIPIAGIGQVFSANSSMDWYGAVKLRTGFAFDNLLLYLTGGVAFANIEHRGANNAIGGIIPAGIISFNNSETRLGWVVGAGTEYALTNRITWRSEATYTRFEDQNFGLNIAIPGAPTIGLNAMDEVWMVKTGLNFKF